MSPLLWWLIPVTATAVAMVLVSLLSRPRRPTEKYDQIKEFHRFCEAMEDRSTQYRVRGESEPVTPTAE